MKKAARAKKTKARGEESPDAELGALVEDTAPVEEVVFEAVELDPDELVFEAEDVLELFDEAELVDVIEEPVEVVEASEDVEEEAAAEDAEEGAAEDMLLAPPISWNCGL